MVGRLGLSHGRQLKIRGTIPKALASRSDIGEARGKLLHRRTPPETAAFLHFSAAPQMKPLQIAEEWIKSVIFLFSSPQ